MDSYTDHYKKLNNEISAGVNAEILSRLQGNPPEKTHSELVAEEKVLLKEALFNKLSYIKTIHPDAIILCEFENGSRDNPPNWTVSIYNVDFALETITEMMENFNTEFADNLKHVFLFTSISTKKPNTENYIVL